MVAGRWAAQQVKDNNTNGVLNGNVCLLFQDFGRDTPSTAA